MSEFAKYGYNFFWSFKGAQPDFEFILPAKDNVPSATLIYAKDKKITTYVAKDGVLKYEPLHTFLLTAINNRASQMYHFPGLLPLVLTTDSWIPRNLRKENENENEEQDL